MLRLYCPPTLNSASVICPKLATLTVSISSSKTLPPNLATSCNCFSAAAVASGVEKCKYFSVHFSANYQQMDYQHNLVAFRL